MKLVLVIGLLCLAGATAQAVNLVSSTTWLGNGGYKIPQQDIWPFTYCTTCTIGSNWNGTTASLAGFKKQVIGGMLWMKAGSSAATSVTVTVTPLTQGASVISSTAQLCAATTDYTKRDVEVFVSTYVQIQGMTELSWPYQPYEERDLPSRFQNPYTVNVNNNGIANGASLWSTRPDANKFYPDALVPQECVSGGFTVAASSSQGVWLDFYLDSSLSSGTYSGNIVVKEGVTVSTTIPIQVTVYNGTLPDQPSYNYLAYLKEDNINYRLNGIAHGLGCTTAACLGTDNAFYQMLHRHRLIPFGDAPDTSTQDFPSARYRAQIDGSLFSTANGYRGPGASTGIPVYSIGSYGSWSDNPNWSATNAGQFSVAVSSWGFWFKNNAPTVRSFVYLADEPTSLTLTNKWSTWMSTITASQTAGYTVHSFVTQNWVQVNSSAVYVDNPASTNWIDTSFQQTDWQTAATRYLTTGSTQGWSYNGHPSSNGTPNATEDDGISAWEGVWADDLKGVQGHLQWHANNWYNPGQQSPSENPLWTQARTFGFDVFPTTNSSFGHFGFHYANGDGMWMYPGTEVSTYTASNYGVLGPIASLRLKYVRRSIDDHDYLVQAYAIDPSSTTAILQSLVPSALWDINCFTYSDCSYSYGGRLWSLDPQAWEYARQRLATIIQNAAPTPPSGSGTKSITGGGRLSGGGRIL